MPQPSVVIAKSMLEQPGQQRHLLDLMRRVVGPLSLVLLSFGPQVTVFADEPNAVDDVENSQIDLAVSSPATDFQMDLIVREGAWGRATIDDLEILFVDIASQIHRELRNPIEGKIFVTPAPPTDFTARVAFRPNDSWPYTIQLKPRNTRWVDYASQFSHEFCHIIMNYDKLKNNPNTWFHEALCELATVYTLRRMAERWADEPPLQQWQNYAPEFSKYSENLLERNSVKLNSQTNFEDWLNANEEEFRKDPYTRYRISIVGYRLLPLFEAYPAGWNTLSRIPISTGPIREYLSEWHAQVDERDRVFIKQIQSSLGFVDE